jgi:two-component system, response regulator RpfG
LGDVERRAEDVRTASRGWRPRHPRLRPLVSRPPAEPAGDLVQPLLEATARVDGDHVARVARYAARVAEALGLDEEDQADLGTASALHDLGKLGISDAILLKPGALTEEERREMRRHPEIGYRLLSGWGVPMLDLAAEVAWTHHERYDGEGYPRGLAGEAIPLSGRIAAVADVFDALTTHRVYRAALPVGDASAVMLAASGSHFDPEVLEALFDAIWAGHSRDLAPETGASVLLLT